MVYQKSFLSRKRKQLSPHRSSFFSLNSFTGRFTRSKSQSLLHRSRSGRAWLGRSPMQKEEPLLIVDDNNLVENPRKMQQNLGGRDSLPRAVSVQTKYSGRARSQVRVSTILASNGVGEKELEFGGKRVSLNGLESDVLLNLGCKSLDSGLPQPDREQMKGNTEDSNTAMPVQLDKEGGSSQDNKDFCCLDKRNAHKSGNRLGKVFKAPTSLNYRRLLPFLTEMAKNNSSAPCNTQNVEIVETSLPSDLVTCGASKIGDAKENSDNDMQTVVSNSQDPVERLDLEEPPNNLTQSEGLNEASTVDQANKSNSGLKDITEECFQTTPPDAAILSKFGIDDKRGIPYIETPNTTCKEYVCDAGNSQLRASKKNDCSPKTKPILNRCSQVKIFKSSSFSYRRLLPYLMDVSKGASNIVQPPTFENDFTRSSESESLPTSGEDVSVDKISHTDLHAKLDAEKQVSNACPVALPVDASSDPVNASSAPVNASSALVDTSSAPVNASSAPITSSSAPVNASSALVCSSSALVDTSSAPVNASSALVSSSSAPVNASSAPADPENLDPLASSDTSVTGGTNATSEAATIEFDMQCVQLEQTVKDEAFMAKTDVQLPFNSEAATLHKRRKLHHNELNCSVEKFNPTTSSELLSLEPEAGCLLLESGATSNNSLLPTQNHSHTKGILKRNPRGCRGLCNCLNCSSFRLHAERSFEFSKNQLLDAEELALGLMDELATLRNLLEKNDEAESKRNQLQVKEACRKALIKEQVAKQQLTVMNENLNVHSRHACLLRRPRVTFSEHNEERLFSKEIVKVEGTTRHQ